VKHSVQATRSIRKPEHRYNCGKRINLRMDMSYIGDNVGKIRYVNKFTVRTVVFRRWICGLKSHVKMSGFNIAGAVVVALWELNSRNFLIMVGLM
jgi:hypothetical protein